MGQERTSNGGLVARAWRINAAAGLAAHGVNVPDLPGRAVARQRRAAHEVARVARHVAQDLGHALEV